MRIRQRHVERERTRLGGSAADGVAAERQPAGQTGYAPTGSTTAAGEGKVCGITHGYLSIQ